MTSTIEKPNILSCQQIKDMVGNGWAVIRNPEYDGCIFLRGELIYYGYDKSDVYRKERTAGEKHVLYMYCGKRDPNIVYLL